MLKCYVCNFVLIGTYETYFLYGHGPVFPWGNTFNYTIKLLLLLQASRVTVCRPEFLEQLIMHLITGLLFLCV